MAWTPRTAASGNQGDASTFTVTKPTGCVNGDLIVVASTTDLSGAVGAPDGTWTNRINLLSTGSDQRLVVYSKIASGEGASWAFTGPASVVVWGAQAWSGGVNTLDVAASSRNNASSAPPDISVAGITTVTNGDLLLYFGTFDGGGAASNAVAPPNGWTEVVEAYVSGTGLMYVASLEQVTAGSTGTIAGTITLQTENAVGMAGLLAFNASGGGGSYLLLAQGVF